MVTQFFVILSQIPCHSWLAVRPVAWLLLYHLSLLLRFPFLILILHSAFKPKYIQADCPSSLKEQSNKPVYSTPGWVSASCSGVALWTISYIANHYFSLKWLWLWGLREVRNARQMSTFSIEMFLLSLKSTVMTCGTVCTLYYSGIIVSPLHGSGKKRHSRISVMILFLQFEYVSLIHNWYK